MTNSTTSTLNNLLKNFFVPNALKVLYFETPLIEFAVKAAQPQGSSTITYWNSFKRLAGASSALAEGGSNTTVALSSRRVSATIAQYGRGHSITDLAEFASVLNLQEGAKNSLNGSAKETQEFVCHMGIFKNSYYANQGTTTILSSVMSSLASSFCANTGTSSVTNVQMQFPVVFGCSATRLSAVSATAPSASGKLSVHGIRKAVLKLQQKGAQPMADGYYVGYAHPNALNLLRRDPTWLQWNVYQNSKETMYKAEVGKVENVRFVMSQLCPRYAVTAHSCNLTFIFGQEAFGVTEALGGLSMYIVSGADSNNIYDTVSSITYKLSSAAACLNPSAGVILITEEYLKQ